MKRLRKATHLVLVWTVVCLLFVDPAAACRLLHRRCCRQCCPSAPVSCCTTVMPMDVMPMNIMPMEQAAPVQPSPSDAPPGTTRNSAQLPMGPNVYPVPAYPVPAMDQERPMPTEWSAAPPALAPQQSSGPAITTIPNNHAPNAAQPRLPALDQLAPAVSQPISEAPVADDGARPFSTTPKSPAKPEFVKPTEPIVPPAFPPVDDDPFAPVSPSTAAPRQPQPVDDDPFAPITPAPAPQPKAAPPVVAEPTLKRIDPLMPDADGRLPLRSWTDNSGQFHVKARLILILDGKVRLLKETGRTTTVPMERLSATDKAYVAEIIVRYGQDLAKLNQLVAR